LYQKWEKTSTLSMHRWRLDNRVLSGCLLVLGICGRIVSDPYGRLWLSVGSDATKVKERRPMSEPNPDELAPSEGTSSQSSDGSANQTSTLGTLARLLVGGALLGRDAIGSAIASTTESARDKVEPAPDDQAADGEGVAATTDVPPPARSLRHILIGAMFETGERIERRGESALRRVGRTTSPAIRWARRSRLTAPARHRFDALSARGEARVQRWMERGALEEQRSRALLNDTVTKAANTSLDRVVDSPQVQGLVEEFVQAQGQTMGRRVLQELRALAVSGDLRVAQLARRVLRHPKPEVPPFPRAVPAPAPDPTPPPDLRGRAAGFVSRLVAFMIDVIFISISIRATGWILDDIRMVTGWHPYLPAVTSTGDYTTPIYVTVGGGLIISAAYFVFFWAVAGVTPGKALMGLRVVTRSGGRLSLIRSMIRLFGYWVSTLLYGLGYLWIAIDNRREAWHDKIARTAVIYAWDAHRSTRSLDSMVAAAEDPDERLP
jgi:uncharacterized RDD family membrane protein YckC